MDGLIIQGSQLFIDVAATRKNVESLNSQAYALAMGIAYPTKDTIKPLLQTAHQKAMALSVSAAIPTKDTIGELIRKANMQMTSLGGAVEKVKPKTA